MEFKTADLCDKHADALQIAEPIFVNFGNRVTFSGPIVTLKVFEDNSLLRTALQEPGNGRVLVVDGGGSIRCALMGETLAKLAWQNGWIGVIINGCIRHSAAIAHMNIGVRALATHPLRSSERGVGERNTPVRFASVYFVSGEYLYADEDGLVVSQKTLL